jgi:6-phosphofructokinase 2
MTSPIVTVTLNPALDLSALTSIVSPHHKLRCSPPRFDAGGGGINVSRVCQRLGVDSVAIAPVGGSFGRQLAVLLEQDGINTSLIPIKANTRLSVTVTEEEQGDDYRFVFPGPELHDIEVDALLGMVESEAATGATVVVSGSFPPGRGEELLTALVARTTGSRLIIDTSGPALRAAVQQPAFLVKPSARELAQVVGRELTTEVDIEEAADEVIAAGPVEALLVSIGAGGAVLRTREGAARFRAPTVRVNSTVGAGDSLVAGIVVGLSRGMDLPGAVALGVAAGTATCLSPGTNLCEPSDIDRLLPRVLIS